MQDACMNGVWARIKSVRGCCGPIIDGKKKHLMSKTKINSYEPYLNVKNLYFIIYKHFHALLFACAYIG
jgi:hypothetical protein